MKINEVTINEGDSFIFTVGNLEQNIFPTEADLKKWKKIFFNVEKGNFTAVCPPVWELTVIHNNRKRKEKK